MEAGGGIWVRGDASDEVWYERIAEFSVAADDVVEDFLQPGISRIHGSGGDGERTIQTADRSSALIDWSVAECGGVWRPTLSLRTSGIPNKPAVLPVFDHTRSRLDRRSPTCLPAAATSLSCQTVLGTTLSKCAESDISGY